MYRKYDQAQTPYQRILADETISAVAKQKLTAQFQSLDPLALQRQIHTSQEQLWQYADTRSLRSPQPSPVELEALFNTEPSILENKLTPPDRFYRHTKSKSTHSKPRYWRTRKDPFADVWQEVEQQLQLSPHLSAKILFLALQKKYPGKFMDGQLRTLQRRVKSWRIEQASIEQANGIDILEETELKTELGDRL